MRTLALAAVLASFTAFAADDVDPDTVAKVRSEQKAAKAAIDAKHGNKKPGDLSKSEAKEIAKEKNEADMKVLNDNKVDPKSYARTEAKMGKDDRASADAAEKKIDKKNADDAKAADEKKKSDAKGKEVVIEKGKGGGKGGQQGGPPAGTPEADAAEAAAADREMKKAK